MLICIIWATHTAHIILFHHQNIWQKHNYETPHYVIFSNPMMFNLSYVQIQYSLQNHVIIYILNLSSSHKNKYWYAEATYLWCTFIISLTNLWKTSIYIYLSTRVDYFCCMKVANLGHASSWVHCHLNKVIVTTMIILKLLLLTYKKKIMDIWSVGKLNDSTFKTVALCCSTMLWT